MEIKDLKNYLSSYMIIHNTIQSCGLKKNIPHEWIFIKLLKKHLEAETCIKFLAFVETYFPDYLWIATNYYDVRQMIVLECDYFDYIFKESYRFNIDISQNDLNRALKFGEIVTQFCIQYFNYSLIGCGGIKSIITAQAQCDKKFEKFLDEGYKLFRLPKIYYVPSKQYLEGYFKELPILPTNNLYYGNDEYVYNANKEFSKVLKY